MCEEESDDQEAVAKLFEINDSIHRTIERYKLIKKGDVDGASKIPQGTLGTSTGVSKTADNELSLIDFSGDPEPAASANGDLNGSIEQRNVSLQDDLLGLSVQDQDYGQGGGIALGFGANSSKRTPNVLLESMLTLSAKTYLDHHFYHQPRRTAPQKLQRRLQHLNHSKLLWLLNRIMTLSSLWLILSLHHDRVHLHHPHSSKASRVQDPQKPPMILLPLCHRPLHEQHHHSHIHNHFKSLSLRNLPPCSTLRLRNLQYLRVSLQQTLNKLLMAFRPMMTGISPRRYLMTVRSSHPTVI